MDEDEDEDDSEDAAAAAMRLRDDVFGTLLNEEQLNVSG